MPIFPSPRLSGAVTRFDLADHLHRETGLPRSETDRIMKQLLGHISAALCIGEEVKISSFGSLKVRTKRARQGRDMQTGKPVLIPQRRVVLFRPSPNLLAKASVSNESNVSLAPDLDD